MSIDSETANDWKNDKYANKRWYNMTLRDIKCWWDIYFSVCNLIEDLIFMETPAILKQNQNGGYSSQCM